jgi:hypothetical protein
MDAFVTVKTIRLKENHTGEGIYITLDGKRIQEPIIENICKEINK